MEMKEKMKEQIGSIKHRQVSNGSCIPMSVELVLKAIGLMDENTFIFQNDSTTSYQSHWVKGLTYPFGRPRVRFARQFLLTDYPEYSNDRGQHFFDDGHFEKLFATIDKELDEGRYVIISLKSGENCYHMEVIYNKISDKKYETVTYDNNGPSPKFYEHNLRDRVEEMGGTDILTYKWI